MSAKWAADPNAISAISGLMRLLAHPTRLRVIGLLRGGKMNVTTLCEELGQAQPTISHHIAMLREGGLLIAQKDWREHFYTLNPEHFKLGENDWSLQLSFGTIQMDIG